MTFSIYEKTPWFNHRCLNLMNDREFLWLSEKLQCQTIIILAIHRKRLIQSFDLICQEEKSFDQSLHSWDVLPVKVFSCTMNTAFKGGHQSSKNCLRFCTDQVESSFWTFLNINRVFKIIYSLMKLGSVT